MKIDELFKKEIGGLGQWISIRAEDDAKPVLLMLHGGPGTPCMSFFRKYNGALAKHFIMVTWDQRGTGRSYGKNIPPESMNMEQMIEDTHEITAYVKDRFEREKIFILGHSFGATLALQVIDRYPEDYLAYFAVSQFVNAARNEEESYEFALRKAMEHNDRKSLKTLNRIGRPVDGFYVKGLAGTVAVKRIVSKYKGDMYRNGSTMRLILRLMVSKEYGFFWFLKSLKGITFSLEYLGGCLKGIDYLTQIPSVDVPVYFFSGGHDYLTPQSILKEYYERLSVPHKKLIVFRDSAHSPLWEEAGLFNQKVIEIADAI
jgi:proline iminopeptidase